MLIAVSFFNPTPPVNDNFADAISPQSGTTVGASREVGEAVIGSTTTSSTIWYTVTVPEGHTAAKVSLRGDRTVPVS